MRYIEKMLLTSTSFYRRNGFSIIGFELYAYSNTDPEWHEVRIEITLSIQSFCGSYSG